MGLVDENQRLRQELEMLKASVRSGTGEVGTAARSEMVHGDIGAPPGLTVLESRVPNSNPTGLSGHSREPGGQAGLSDLAKVPSGNLAGRPGHDDQRPGEEGRLHGGLEGNPAGLMGHGGGISEGADVASYNLEGMSMKDVLHREVEGLRGKSVHVPGGNLSGLPERGGEPRGRVSFQEGDGECGEFRVPNSNPAGLSGHSRRGGHYVNMQYASSASGPFKQQYASSASGPSTWNPLGIGDGIKNQAGENEVGLKDDRPKLDEGLVASPMEALLKGMSQLHQAMTLQLDRQSNKPEAIRPGITGSELPKLPEADEYAAINVGDWLHGLTGPMGDLTDGSGGWWADVMKSLDDYYKEYLAAATVRKVQLKAEDFARPGVKEERWSRVDKRAASMLLQAVPEAIKSELMANRLSTTLAILGRILTIYRPGSSVERQQVLKALESPGVGGSPMDLVEILRKWARWLKRAEDLGLQPPDASILLKGLDVATKPLMEKNNEILFRTNMLRFSLDLDAAPTKTAVLRFHGHLLAEFEQLAYRGRGKGGPTVAAAVRAANAVADAGTSPTSTQKGGSSPSASGSARPCKFFAQESGCQRLNCKFVHDWANIPKEEKSERCKSCGAKGHMKRQCPLRVSSDGGRKGEEGKGAAGPKVRATMASTNKGSDGKRDDGTVPGGEAQQSSSTTSAATTGSTTEAGFPTASTASGPKGSAGEIDDFLKNATQILKMMTEKQDAQQSQGPSMKMLKKAIRRFENRLALVDSGATHPLREARPDEWAEAPEVDVVIAGDGVTTMRQNTAGTLLTEPQGSGRRPQTIVPVGNLIGLLGYELIWSKKKCVLRAPDGREEVLKMTSGCPEVNEALALDLIAKIEQEKLTRLEKAMEDSKRVLVRAMKVEKDPAWEKNLKKYVEFGKFEDGYCAISSMPWATDVMNEDLVRTISDIPHTEKEAWDLMMALGFNRRMRKRMMHKDWIVRFYSGKRSYVDKMFKMFESNGTMVLDIDVMRWTQLDMLNTNKGIMTLMLWGAATGRIAGTFAAIPKGNAFEHALRVVVVNEVAKVGRRAMCEMADVPDDGVAMCVWASSQSEEDESSTIWLHKWFRQWIAHSFLDVMHFDQGAFGHSLRRPTTMATNLDVVELRGAQDRRTEWPTKGVCWASWAPMMVRVLVQGMKRWKQRPGWYTRMVRALKAADRKAWEKHLANDHLPHRADCLQCIHNSTGRPHRKCLHRDCYVLSADTLGPVRVAGPKGEKYAVVFTYQFPKLKMMPEDQPIKEEELVGWDLDAKAREEAGGIGELEVDMDVEFPEECELGLEEEKNGKAEELPDLDTKASTSSTTSPSVEEKIGKAKEDWWEFREAEGILVRHHVATRLQLFRPTKANGCPVPPAKLEPTRVTEVKYVGGGAEMETSDWHGYQSGARSLDKRWTGATTFKISQAEVAEEEDVLEKDEKSWEALIGDLTKPVEMETIYMVYPVRNRRGGDVMLAVQEAVLRLKLLGFPVARLHSDRGSEFASKGLRKWLLERDIFHTRSESLVPQTNGAAERGVRWFKTKAKVLLAEANVAVKYWTLVMQHASNRQIYYKLGLSKPPLLPFGTTVMIRRKVFGNNKKYDLTDRWEQGIYLGLSDTIKGGAIVLRPTGILTETLNLRAGVVDPRRLLQDPVEGGEEGGIEEADSAIIDLPEPDHRLRGKHKPPELRALRLEDEGTSVLDEEEWSMMTVLERQEAKAREFYEKGMFDLSACGEVLQELCIDGRMRTQGRGTEVTSMILGAYVHGGIRGVSAQGRKRPWLMRYLNAVLRKKVKEDLGEEGAWTTVGVFRAADIPPHRDQRNRPMSLNYAVEIGGTQSGGLWVSRRGDVRECRGGGYARDLQQELPDGRVADGTLYNINQKAIAFDPKGEHAYMKPEVERWVLVGFTPLGVEKLMLPSQKILGSCGFPLSGTGVDVPPDSPDEEVESDGDEWYSFDSEESQFEEELENRARVLRCVLQEEIEDVVLDVPESDEYLQRLEYAREVCERDLQELDGQALRRIAKVSPGEAKNYEVEPLLQSLQAPLEVVHNVSLQEVRKNVDKWVASICKEVDALISSGTIRPLSPEQTRELKACGLKVLPGKAVFTAKPPSDAASGEWFRRKCRVVVCGNFLPHGQDNVYASGTSADTLRVSIAYAILRQWTAGCTDISNAFTLAPMPENLLYGVLPPSIVVLAGAAKPGETWKIERVLYGLREAPRLWSLFRNDRLQSARIDYEGRVLVLCNLDTDENLWRVCYEDQPDETAGLMLIYVDDILVLSMTGIIKCIYKWLIAEWKCSALEMLSDGALRFLGVELRLQGDGIHMSQAGYVRDLLRQHGVEEQPGKSLTVPCSREWLQDEDTEDEGAEPEEATVRMAQKVTGEALWLSTRSRPELAHSVACMASKALRKPLRALEISKRVMQYLSKTADYGLLYQASGDDPLLVVYSDASFAPGGGRSFGCIMAQVGGMPVAWRASKQPIITLSVAEAELYEGVAAVQLGLGVAAMVTELCANPVMHLRIDNSAAQGLASEAPGTWKTRHLRVRARFLRQEVALQRLVISHVPGAMQKADIGTKGFDLPKFKELICLWGIVPYGAETTGLAMRALRATTTSGVLLFVILCLMLIRGAEGSKDDLPLDGSVEFYGMIVVCILAGVAVWEGIKKSLSFIRGQWMGCQKKKKKLERLRNRAQAAVQEEIQRQAAPTSPFGGAASSTGPTSRTTNTPPRATRAPSPSRSLRSRTMMTTTPTRMSSSIVERVNKGTQTDGMMFGPERLRGFEGPYFITPHGNRIHLSATCHGQRNAANPARAYRVCQYCDRDRPLFEVTPG